mgnify:CR=1 FL=1
MTALEICARNMSKARSLRDEGIATTMEHTGDAWFETAMADFLRFVCERGESTLESWRFDWLSRGNPPPASHKSYGALAITAARRGIIINTGRYVKAKAEKTHAHRVCIWRAA